MFGLSRPSIALKLLQTLSLKLTISLPTSTSFTQTHCFATTSISLKPLNSKISTCMRNGLIEEAQNLFDEMPQRNTVTWNALIRGYFLNGLFDHAVRFFDRMPERDIFSYNIVVAGLMQRGDVDGAKDLFDKMPYRDVVSWNSMIAGYVQNQMVDKAIGIFDGMPIRNVISWNLLIGGLVNCGQLDLAQGYFLQMRTRDAVSWTIMISGYASAGRIAEARELFDDMPTRDVQAWNSIIFGYIENGKIDVAEVLFHKMSEWNFDSWNILMSGLLRSQRINDAMRLFMEMPEKCQKHWNSITLEYIRSGLIKEAHALLEKTPYGDVVSWTNMIVGYFGIGEVHSAIQVFELMQNRDSTMWNATIFGLGENDRGEQGLKLFIKMKKLGPFPDKATFTSVLAICSDLETLQLGRQTHMLVIKMGFNYFVAVSNAIVTMYAKCGNIDSALLEFSSMPIHDVISWNSIICGFAHHGNGEKALEMFEQMRLADIEPNQITFVGVLSACSHAGLVDRGRYFFKFMKNECLLLPTSEHYTCLVDLLGRFGLIDEAMSFLVQMREDGFEVPASVWGALLGACRIHKNFKVGEIAGERVLEIEPHNSGVYLILAEMYLSSGRREDAERIWGRMKNNGVKKQPGCSWIEANSSGHVFLSGDSSHPEFSRISCIVEQLHMEMEIEIQKPEAADFQKIQFSLDGCYE